MEEDILRIILKYTYEGKIADEKFIYDIFGILIKEYNLYSYINDIKVVKTSPISNGSFAEYIYFQNMYCIRLYLLEFKKHFSNSPIINNLPNTQEKLFYINLFFVEVMRHELEHAYQEYLKDQGNTFESQILLRTEDPYNRAINNNEKLKEITIIDDALIEKYVKKALRFEKLAQKYYTFDPKERIAHLKAKKLILELAKMAQSFPNITTIKNKNLNNAVCSAYRKNLAPTIYFSKVMHLTNNISSLPWYHKNFNKCLEKSTTIFSLSERLLLGLSISKEEYNTIINEYLENEESSLLKIKR